MYHILLNRWVFSLLHNIVKLNHEQSVAESFSCWAAGAEYAWAMSNNEVCWISRSQWAAEQGWWQQNYVCLSDTTLWHEVNTRSLEIGQKSYYRNMYLTLVSVSSIASMVCFSSSCVCFFRDSYRLRALATVTPSSIN